MSKRLSLPILLSAAVLAASFGCDFAANTVADPYAGLRVDAKFGLFATILPNDEYFIPNQLNHNPYYFGPGEEIMVEIGFAQVYLGKVVSIDEEGITVSYRGGIYLFKVGSVIFTQGTPETGRCALARVFPGGWLEVFNSTICHIPNEI